MKKHYTIAGGAAVIAALLFILNLTSLDRNRGDQISSVPPDVLRSSSANIPNGNTLNSIKNELAEREYHITYDSARHALQSPNRRHNLRAYYRPGSLSIQNRIDSAGQNFRMKLVNEGVYADGTLIAGTEPDAVSDNRNDTLRIGHKGFTEEFINNQEGIRQNFIIARAPANTRQVSVRLSVEGLHARQQNAGQLVFYSNENGKKTDRLTYSDLNCWDADGKPLTANLALSGDHIELNVNVENAAYPVTIDPIITNGNPANADKTLEINQSYAWLGFSVSTAGDVNGDGFSDVLIGAPKYDNGQADEGAAFLYPGTASGISLAATVLECNQANAQMGYSVSSAGDINKDGFSDIMVGAPYYDGSASDEGVVMIYKGSAGGLVTNNPYVFKLDQAEANLGVSVAMAGDVNGDGYSDMLAGAHQFDNNQSNEGVGVLILGAPNGLGLVTFLECNQPGAMMGFAVAGAGDVDGDGFSDVMAGARFYTNGQALEGAAFIFKGSANGVVTANPTIIEGNQIDARLGHALSSAGDVNGDGFSDIAIGAYLYDKGNSNEGVVMIHYGSNNGVGLAPAQTLEADQTEAQFGISVACAGDVNADGFADLIVGARYYDKGNANEGAAFIYQGSKNGLNPVPVSVLESNQGDAWLGSAVAPAGDVNGDGFSDVLVGSYAFDNGQKDEGSVFVWYGGAEGVKPNVAGYFVGQKADANLGLSVSAAGDVNGDGYDDILVGAPFFDYGLPSEGIVLVYHGTPTANELDSNPKLLAVNKTGAEFGFYVSGAGDINGDGFSDVIIGAPVYSQGEQDEGAVAIYYGSQQGLNGSPTILESNKIEAYMGLTVSGGGDLNGDGYSDVIAGAALYGNNEIKEGAVYIYYGYKDGIMTTPTVIESNHNLFCFGFSVSNAADLNGDGYDDLLVGADKYSNGENDEGAVYIFYGSLVGPKANSPTILESNHAGAAFGGCVSAAGDINGDGFQDIIVGAKAYDITKLDEGAAFIFYGSFNGPATNNVAILGGNQIYANFGTSVGGAGDVNGDGYSDIIVGAPGYKGSFPEEGAAFVYHGSKIGITNNAMADQVLKSPQQQAFCQTGFSVAGAGDVNGDGYDDVLLGAPKFDINPADDQGAAFCFLGNQGLGTRNNLRLYNTDLTTPINHTQFQQNNFGAGLFAKSFTGRNKGKLVWETKPLAQGFSKGSNNRITNSTQSTSAQITYSNLGTAGFELKNVIDKQGPGTKVRVRVKYDPVLALTGQSYGPWRYLPAYLMGNSTAPVPEEENDLSETVREKVVPLETGKTQEMANVYPNPVSDRLNIDLKSPERVSNIKILTSTGLPMYQTAGFKHSINLKGFSKGIYYLVITQDDGSQITRKILVSQ